MTTTAKTMTVTAPNGRVAKLWVRHPELVEEQALRQVQSMLETPGLFEHIAVMPDVHWGMGATVGAVMALNDAVIPNCVGVDIGCGMAAYPLGLSFAGETATRKFWQGWLKRVMDVIPVGFTCHGALPAKLDELKRASLAERGAQARSDSLRCGRLIAPASKFKSLGEMVLRQTGTLGGGNHFLEIQRDEAGMLWLMVHSGSRNVGLKIATHYASLAKKMNARLGQSAPIDLHWLPLSTSEGQGYLSDMQWAVGYALLNRKQMLRAALGVLSLPFDEARMINIPHNYAAVEEHFGRMVVVHRKGATSARVDELGIVPGSMGAASYIVSGLGNPDAYSSCSHGAGRSMGRRQAKRTLSGSDFAQAVSHTFSNPNESYIDEAPQAYKNIDLVINAQDELVTVLHRLEPVITLKSGEESVD
jgi:tRNA-splicing ligase RtcB